MPIGYVYNWYSSAWLIVLALLVLLIAFLLLKKKFGFDPQFFLALLPFAIFGAAIRALADKALLPYNGDPFSLGYYTHTPGLWLTGGIVFLLVLLLLQRKSENPLPLVEKTGWFLAVVSIAVFVGTGFSGIPAVLLLSLLFFIPFFGWIAAQKIFRSRFLKNELNFFAFSTNAMDCAASLVAFVFLDCFPKHESTGELLAVSPVFFALVKIAGMLAALWLIEKIGRNEQQKGFAKVSLGLFWVMTGFRTVLVIGAGLCGLL